MYRRAFDQSFERIRVELAELEQKIPKSSQCAIRALTVRVHGLSKASTGKQLWGAAPSFEVAHPGFQRGCKRLSLHIADAPEPWADTVFTSAGWVNPDGKYDPLWSPDCTSDRRAIVPRHYEASRTENRNMVRPRAKCHSTLTPNSRRIHVARALSGLLGPSCSSK